MIIDNIDDIYYFEILEDYHFVVKGRFRKPVDLQESRFNASLVFGGKKQPQDSAEENKEVTSIKTALRRSFLQ